MNKWLAALVAAIYLGAFPYHPALRSPNELCRLLQTRALVEYGALDLNAAMRDDGFIGDLSYFQGHFYPSKAPLLSFAAVPVYALLRVLGGGTKYAVPELTLVYFSRFFLTALPTLVMLFFLRRFLAAYVRPRVADAVSLTYALGSLAFSYSLLFMSHQTTAVLLFASFYVLWRLARGELREPMYAAAGAFAAAAVAAEYTGALTVLGLVLYVLAVFHFAEGSLRARLLGLLRAAGWSCLGAFPILAALLVYHAVCFGGPFETGYRHLAQAAYQPWHVGGFLGIKTPDARAFVLSFFSPLRGLFTLSPFLILSFPGLAVMRVRARSNRREWPMLIFVAALWLGYAYFTSSFAYDSWGWTTGPRHLTGLVPFTLLPVALFLQWTLEREGAAFWLAALGAGLCAASVVVTGALTFINYVPDDVKNGFWGFAVPLLGQGYLPPTVLSFLGVPTPWAGIPWVLAVAAGAIAAAALVMDGRGRQAVLHGLAAAIVFAAYLGVLRLASPDEHDAAAVVFLERAWVAPPGTSVPLWPRG